MRHLLRIIILSNRKMFFQPCANLSDTKKIKVFKNMFDEIVLKAGVIMDYSSVLMNEKQICF